MLKNSYNPTTSKSEHSQHAKTISHGSHGISQQACRVVMDKSWSDHKTWNAREIWNVDWPYHNVSRSNQC